MPVLVHPLPRRIDAANVDEFRDALAALVQRRHSVVLDCSELAHITGAGMRVLEGAARHGRITLVHPTPMVHLLASVFGLDVAEGDPSEFTDRDDRAAAVLFTDTRDTGPNPDHATNTELMSELRELTAARRALTGSPREARTLTQFEGARLGRIETRINVVIDALRIKPVRDGVPDGY
jgi:anti-anti-sigma regulatory factor